jgi:hypothetical protein
MGREFPEIQVAGYFEKRIHIPLDQVFERMSHLVDGSLSARDGIAPPAFFGLVEASLAGTQFLDAFSQCRHVVSLYRLFGVAGNLVTRCL